MLRGAVVIMVSRKLAAINRGFDSPRLLEIFKTLMAQTKKKTSKVPRAPKATPNPRWEKMARQRWSMIVKEIADIVDGEKAPSTRSKFATLAELKLPALSDILKDYKNLTLETLMRLEYASGLTFISTPKKEDSDNPEMPGKGGRIPGAPSEK